LETRVLADIPFEIDEAEVFRRVHVEPDGEYGDEIRQIIAKARDAAAPKAAYGVAFVDGKGDDWVSIEGTRFVSRVLRANLDDIGRVFPYVATCGDELDAIPIDPGDVLAVFCRDTIKEMALGAAMSFLSEHVRGTYELKKITAMSPGSGDTIVWPIEQQVELFGLLGDTKRLVGVTLTDSCLMIPNKSVSGLFYPSEHDFVTCRLCHREKCEGRRAAFDQHLWEEKVGGQAKAVDGGA